MALALGAAVLAGGLAGAQTRPAFDVASLKPSPPRTGDLLYINLGTASHGTLTLSNACLADCLRYAYSITNDEQIAGPDWIKFKDVHFEIEAKASAGGELGEASDVVISAAGKSRRKGDALSRPLWLLVASSSTFFSLIINHFPRSACSRRLLISRQVRVARRRFCGTDDRFLSSPRCARDEANRWGSQSWLPPPFRRRARIGLPPHFFMKFRGPKALSNRPRKPMACPTSVR
jgi:hypothetical protein